MKLALFFITIFITLTNVIFSQSYKYEGKISFVVSSRFGEVKGEFQKINIVVTTNKIGSQVFVEVSSITTGNKMRDNHLKEEDFFHVEKYPQARFVLNSLTKMDEKLFRGNGILYIKNNQKEIDFPVKMEKILNGLKYYGEFEIDRMDFGITYNSIINPISQKTLIQYEILEKVE